MTGQARWKLVAAGGVLLLTLAAVGSAWAMRVAKPGWTIIIAEPGSTVTITQPGTAGKGPEAVASPAMPAAAVPSAAAPTAAAPATAVGGVAAAPGAAASAAEQYPTPRTAMPMAAISQANGRGLGPGTTFYAPRPNQGAVEQIAQLTSAGRGAEAGLIREMIETPQAAWFTGGTGISVEQDVRNVVHAAAEKAAVPVLVAYNVPGRDCSQYSAGGAASGDAYKAWIDGFLAGLGNAKAVVLLEPDGLALLPTDCGQPDTYGRVGLINDAAHKLLGDPNAAVYLDAGHSAWHAVGDIAKRLVDAGVQDVQGFYLNPSNYQFTANSVQYGSWISQCIAYATGVKAGDYTGCPNQYYNGGPAGTKVADLLGPWTGGELNRYGEWSDDAAAGSLNTSGINRRYADLLVGRRPAVHFIVDTSRNGQGPWQPPAGHTGTDAQDWCNPPGRGLGQPPTVDTGNPLVDAYVWLKIPGESDGQCYRWTGGPNDPVRNMQDPAAGQWFPEMALELVGRANPALR